MTYTGNNYNEIEAALVRLGATEQEADALTDILHDEGWGVEEDGELTDEILSAKIEWLRENRPVDPREGWDDSNYIDIVEAAKAEWVAAHPECEEPTTEDTDKQINKALGLSASGSLRGLATDLRDMSDEEITASVKAGMDAWIAEAQRVDED